jgi:hypothetical protein
MPFSLLLYFTMVATSCENLHLSPRVHMPLVKSKQIWSSSSAEPLLRSCGVPVSGVLDRVSLPVPVTDPSGLHTSADGTKSVNDLKERRLHPASTISRTVLSPDGGHRSQRIVSRPSGARSLSTFADPKKAFRSCEQQFAAVKMWKARQASLT